MKIFGINIVRIKPHIERSNTSFVTPVYYFSQTKPCSIEKYGDSMRENIERHIENYLATSEKDSQPNGEV